MDDLPDQLVLEILVRIVSVKDRNCASLACKRFHWLENEERQSLQVGCGLDPPTEALTSLCSRFPNLRKVKIIYAGWESKFGRQLDDEGLLVLSNSCPSLMHLTLSYCTYITDVGLGYLASCSRLLAFELNFSPKISGCGILSLIMGCKNLTHFHLNRCLNVSSFEWLEYLGKLEALEDLSIRNCRAIGEGDLVKLGPTWRRLKRLQFQVDGNYRYMKVYDQLVVDQWQKQWIRCDNMSELHLVNCVILPGRGLACVFGKCKNLKKIHLEMCTGLRDCDIIKLAKTSSRLQSLSLRVPCDFPLPLMMPAAWRLSDESLKTVAQCCPMLQSVKISFAGGDFPTFFSFTLDGIVTLMQTCPVRELTLDCVCTFNDVGMQALCSAQYLETLELIGCHEISDDGLQHAVQFPQLSTLRLTKCSGITNDGLKPFVGSEKLGSLIVDDCPLISEWGLQGTAKTVSFKQD